MIKIIEKDFESFFKVPFKIRGKKSLYAAPFKPELKKMLSTRNPMFQSENNFTFFTAFKDGLLAGRICTHIHHEFNERYKTKKCYFGFFECINDQEVANELFMSAEKFAKDKGYDNLCGNYNLTAMQEMGVMVDGFDNEPYILQSFGLSYYPELMKNAGFYPTFPMNTYEIDLTALDPEKIISEKQRKLLLDPEYEFVPVTRKEYQKLRPYILDIFNKGFGQNELFVPISQEEFDFQGDALVYFMDSNISFIAKHKGVPIGVSIHIPDINPLLRETCSKIGFSTLYHFLKYKFKRDRTLCVFSSIMPEYQNNGVLGVIIYLAMVAMKKRGYKRFGITWISESNTASLKKMEDLKAKKIHALRIFEKQLN